ncbi:MAG: DUF2277 domain-containing protein [Bauldia sp.]|jgi:hypothetical protein
MCRNIRPLFNFDPPTTEDEIRKSAIQYVRKVSGFVKPSQANEAAFNRAIEETTATIQKLLDAMVTNQPPKDRAIEAAKAKERYMARFA